MIQKRGFTLVEVLFVVIITAGALALALPSLKGVRERTKFQASLGRLVAIGSAVEGITRDLAMQGINIRVGDNISTHFMYYYATDPDSATFTSSGPGSKKDFKSYLYPASGLTEENREKRVVYALQKMGYLKRITNKEIQADPYRYFVLNNDASSNSTVGPCVTGLPTGAELVACMLKATRKDTDCFLGARYLQGGQVQTVRGSKCKD